MDEMAIRRAAERWLRPRERAWCATQPSLREALVTVLTCKEAAFKAFSSAPVAHDLSLTMHGSRRSGWVALDGVEPDLVAASWQVSEASILGLAVASPSGRARRLLRELASELRQSGLTRACDTLHPAVTASA
jgi:hypothetical protein